jgi:modification target Cys-rich repeat protein
MLSMKRKMLLRLVALPLVIAACAVPTLAGCSVIGDAACPDFNEGANFGAALDLDANVKTFMQAAGRFDILGQQMVADVGAACIKVAVAAGGDEGKWSGKEGSDLVEAACTEADERLKIVLNGVTVNVAIAGGGCQASLQATADCNAQCDVNAKCTPAELQAQCEPGKLSGSCSAECKGSCDIKGPSVACSGTCGGTCSGTCGGTCAGKCDGTESTGDCKGMCEGTCQGGCEGSCNGTCTYTPGTAQCSGTCHGDCSVEYQEPYCEGKLTPPKCDIDAKCEANCEASVQAQAECTPPAISYELKAADGTDLTALAAALQEALPVFIVNTVDRGEGLVQSADALVTSGQAIANAAGDLSVEASACAGVALDAAVAAAANVSVSVQFSVKVSASASASGSTK